MKKLCLLTAAAVISAFSLQAYALDDVDPTICISELRLLGVVNGYEDGEFHPDREITRAEMIKIASNLMPESTNMGIVSINFSKTPLFPDLDFSHWAYNDIDRMHTLNIANGYEDGNFYPDSPITYQEALKIIIEMLNYGEEVENSGGYPNGYITTAEKLGITNGVNFNASDNASRENLATIVYNTLDIPHRVISSYTVGGNAVYETDENITFRSMIRQ